MMMTPDEIIAIVQAHKDGRVIQSRLISNVERPWHDCNPLWAFDRCEYRVKPEPRDLWIDVYPISPDYPTEASIRPGKIHFREVL